ncbi:MAG: class I SAM-dependent methyltransferase [Pseudomonadota bacterium]
MSAKIVLSRLPIDYRRFAHLGMFRHGDMQGYDYALGVVRYHASQAGIDLQGKTCLELGPGDGITGGLVARSLGAQHVYLVDAGAFADADISLYQTHCEAMRSAGLAPPDITHVQDFGELLHAAGLTYLTNGLSDLQALPPDHLDFVWSHAVLEHVRAGEFGATMQALARSMRPGARASHRVDLQDHLANSLHNPRFSTKLWEQDWLANSGFYTNRIGHQPMLDLFTAAGFTVHDVTDIDRWDRLPLPREKFATEFRTIPDAELTISSFTAILQR